MVTMLSANVFVLVCLKLIGTYADVLVRDSHHQLIHSYDSEEALFGPRLPDEGIEGHLMVAEPINACSDVSKVKPNGTILIALIRRETCTFAKKVFNVQKAGYGAAIVYNVGSDELVPMRGDGETGPILISSVFVGETSGLALKQLSFNFTVVLKEERTDHSIFFVPFAIVFPMCALVMCFFFCVRCIMDQLKKQRLRLSKSNLKKLPVKKYKKGDKFEVCAVCLEEYEDGDKLRELPCAHAYHQKCIDPWLTKTKQTCPLCNKKVFPTDDDSDAENGNEENRSNENTPLLTARGNTMFDYGISAASRTNDQRTDSDSDESVSQSPNEALSNRVISTAEVHSKPNVVPTSVSRGNTAFIPAANDLEVGGATGCDVTQENVGHDLIVAETAAAGNGENGSGVAVVTDPFLVEARRTNLPSGDSNHIV